MSYAIKDVFLTLQGDGLRAGTKALFVRFSGCNLWSGDAGKRDDGKGACAQWCDTDFFKGQKTSASDLLLAMDAQWLAEDGERWCVLTGGEPCLQVDEELLAALAARGWSIAMESNGTDIAAVQYVDHLCIAPKLGADGQPNALPLLEQALGHHVDLWEDGDPQKPTLELKVVLPGDMPGRPGWTRGMLDALVEEVQSHKEIPFEHLPSLYVQPQDPLVDSTVLGETVLTRRGQQGVTAAHVGKKRRALRKSCDGGWAMATELPDTQGDRSSLTAPTFYEFTCEMPAEVGRFCAQLGPSHGVAVRCFFVNGTRNLAGLQGPEWFLMSCAAVPNRKGSLIGLAELLVRCHHLCPDDPFGPLEAAYALGGSDGVFALCWDDMTAHGAEP